MIYAPSFLEKPNEWVLTNRSRGVKQEMMGFAERNSEV